MTKVTRGSALVASTADMKFAASAQATADARIASKQPTHARPVIIMHQTRSGQWVVRDEPNLRGGTFHDLKSAQKYIKRTFAVTSTVIVQPRFADATPQPQ